MKLLVILADLSCLSPSGTSQDWFAAIKQNGGVSTVYVDSFQKWYWKVVPPLTMAQNPVIQTLQQLWNHEKEYQALFFNDETDIGDDSSVFAHQKGVLAFDQTTMTGFYLMHSTPGWPKSQFAEPTVTYSNLLYAQHFFCVNIDLSGLNLFADMLLVTRPQMYSDTFSKTFLAQHAPVLKRVIDGEYTRVSNATWATLTSRKGQKFDLFFKNRQWQQDLWANLVAPSKQQSITAETWIRDSSAVPSCGQFKVQMAGKVKLAEGFVWKNTNDHSKWAVADSEKFACFSDINFMASQKNRGGAAICIDDLVFGAAMKRSVRSLTPSLTCP